MSENGHRSIILLSGGLDSVVSFGLLREKLNVELALTFDYGQKSLGKEVQASKWYCDLYKSEHKIIKLDWLKNITKTSLVSDKEIPDEENSKAVWVPNRNGLFLNILGRDKGLGRIDHMVYASFSFAQKYNVIVLYGQKLLYT